MVAWSAKEQPFGAGVKSLQSTDGIACVLDHYMHVSLAGCNPEEFWVP